MNTSHKSSITYMLKCFTCFVFIFLAAKLIFFVTHNAFLYSLSIKMPDYSTDFIIIDKRNDKSLRLLEGDMDVIYGICNGVNSTDYYETNIFNDTKVPVEVPEIQMLYFVLLDE